MSLTKRVYKDRKKIFILGSGTFLAFFTLLLGLGAYGVGISTSGDITCGYCNSTFNITLQNYSLCFGSTFNGVSFDSESGIEWWRLYKADLRYRADNPARWKPTELKAGMCLEAGKRHEYLIEAKKKDATKTVKWSIGYGFSNVDPYWFGVEEEKKYAIERVLSDFYDITFNETDWSFEIMGKVKKDFIKLKPTIMFGNEKYEMSKIGMGTEQSHLITKSRQTFYFALNVSKGLTIPESVQSASFEIIGNTSGVIVDGNIIRIGMFEIDFSDLAKNFNITLNESEIKINDIGTKELNFDPTVKWNTGTNLINSLSAAPLDNNTFVISFCDDTQDKTMFKVFDTNGTNTTGEVSVDDTSGQCNYYSTDFCPLNSTTGVLMWFDAQSNSSSAAIINRTGSILVSKFDIDTGVGASWAVSCTALNSTYWVGCYIDNPERDASCNVYDLNTATGSVIDVDTEVVGGASTYPNAISVTALNSTAWVTVWYDRNESDATFIRYNFRTAVGSATDEDTNVGAGARSVHAAAINNTHWAFAYVDDNDADATYSVYNYASTTRITGPVDIDTSIGTVNTSMRVGVINSTYIVLLFYDDADFDLAYGINQTVGTGGILARTNIENYASRTNPARFNDIAAWRQSVGIGFCNQNFIVVYANSTTVADFRTYYASGEAWPTGNCSQIPFRTNITSPQNTTYAYGNNIWFNLTANTNYIDSCVVNYSYGNMSMTNSTGNWNHLNSTLSSVYAGSKTAVFCCNDTWGYVSCSNVTFTINSSLTYSQNSTNSTIAGDNIKHSLYWLSNAGLSGYVFSFCNGTWTGTSCNDIQTQNETGDSYNITDIPRFYVNYTKPTATTLKGAVLTYKFTNGTGSDTYVLNTTIPDICFTQNPIRIRWNSSVGASSYSWISCWNGASWLGIKQLGVHNPDGSSGSGNGGLLYDGNWGTYACVDLLAGDWAAICTSSTIGRILFWEENMTWLYNDWVNDSWVAMTGTGNWSNVTKSVNTTTGVNISWCVSANDTSNNWNYTSCAIPFTYTTTSTGTCSCPALGNWVGNCADNCVISSNCDMQGNNVSITGTGVWTLNANVTNFTNVMVQGTSGTNICEVRCTAAGCFRK